LIVLLPLSSHTSARKPVGKQFDRKPTQQGSRHIESPPTGNLERYDNRRNVITHHQSEAHLIGRPVLPAHSIFTVPNGVARAALPALPSGQVGLTRSS
jgi:hypothetical protein